MKTKHFMMLLLLIACVFRLSATDTEAQTVDIKTDHLSIRQLFTEIEKQTDYLILLRNDDVDVNRIVHLKSKTGEPAAILDEAFRDTGIHYVFENKYIVLSKSNPSEQQQAQKQAQKKITGRVVDEKGEAIIGASVAEKGTSNGTITDIDGNFSLNTGENAVLQVSFIGYHSRQIAVGAQTNLEITLQEDVQALDEVVVVGYSTQKKAHLSGAVSTISSKALENRPVSNANLALQGLAPNVNIRSANGNPMQTPDINVRGYTSINGGSALILVNNVPMSAAEFSFINPADIDNISVLKDAASAAIYGARAAYGVILVTTKTAKNNKLEINADLNYGVRQELNVYKYDFDLVNFMETINLASGDASYSAAQIDYARQRMANPSLPEIRLPAGAIGYDPNYPTLTSDATRYDYYAITDWHDLITNKLPAMTNANISIGQRTDRMSFVTSAAYYQSNGVYVGENPTKRYNIRAGGDYKLFDWWTLGASITFARTENDNPHIIGKDGASGATASLSSKYIKNPPKNPDGTWTESGAEVLGQLTEGGRHITKQNQTLFTFNTQFDVIKDVFNIKSDATIRLHNQNTNTWRLAVLNSRGLGNVSRSNDPQVSYYSSENIFTVFNLYGDFHRTFGGKHFVQALAGFNQEHRDEANTSVWQNDMISENFPTLALTTGQLNRSQAKQALALRGAFGRLNYTFDNRYIIEFNGRYDGTSRYAKENRFGFFPSITGAWIASSEKFLKPVTDMLEISFLKFRASYGSLGNQASGGYYPYFSTMGSPSPIGLFIDSNRPLGIGRPGGEAAGDLSWETVRTINAGLNLGLFKNRLTVEFDRYTRYTEGMLAPAKPIPGQFGASVANTNAADLKTKGWELDLTWRDEIKDVAGSPFSYSVRFMLADARAWITKYDNPNKLLGSWREGQEVGEIWGFVVPGLFQSDEEALLWHDQTVVQHPRRSSWGAGDMKFTDLDGNGRIDYGASTEADPGDRRIIGNDQIRLPYSIDISSGWKNFDLRVFFQGIGKRDWYPYTTTWNINNGNQEFWSSYQGPWRTPSIYIRDYWREDNPDGYYPRRFLQFGQEHGTDNNGGYNREWDLNNTRYLQNAAYLRIKNLTLGYTLPRELTSKWGISRLRVYFSGENLWTLSHIHVDAIDPETIGSGYTMYPMQKVYSMGFNISF